MPHRSYSGVETALYGPLSTSKALQRIRRTTAVSIAVVVVIAAVVSYPYMHAVVLRHDESQ